MALCCLQYTSIVVSAVAPSLLFYQEVSFVERHTYLPIAWFGANADEDTTLYGTHGW